MILRLDVDAGRMPCTIGRLAWLLSRAGFVPVWLSQVRSPSGKGWHVEVKVTPAPRSRVEVVALQAILGSDQAREACNLHRAHMVETGQVPKFWQGRWNVLYE
jgi:hypothetical protein